MINAKNIRRKLYFKEAYPLNLLLTISEDVPSGVRLKPEKIQQDNLDGLQKAMSLLPDKRSGEVLRLRYEDRLTYEKIGGVYGVTVERARMLVHNAERKLRTPPLYPYIWYGKQGREKQILMQDEAKKNQRPEDKYLYEIDLSVRVGNRLIVAGCRTVKDVADMNTENILKMKDFGEKSRKEVAEKLASLGITGTDWEQFI